MPYTLGIIFAEVLRVLSLLFVTIDNANFLNVFNTVSCGSDLFSSLLLLITNNKLTLGTVSPKIS